MDPIRFDPKSILGGASNQFTPEEFVALMVGVLDQVAARQVGKGRDWEFSWSWPVSIKRQGACPILDTDDALKNLAPMTVRVWTAGVAREMPALPLLRFDAASPLNGEANRFTPEEFSLLLDGVGCLFFREATVRGWGCVMEWTTKTTAKRQGAHGEIPVISTDDRAALLVPQTVRLAQRVP